MGEEKSSFDPDDYASKISLKLNNRDIPKASEHIAMAQSSILATTPRIELAVDYLHVLKSIGV